MTPSKSTPTSSMPGNTPPPSLWLRFQLWPTPPYVKVKCGKELEMCLFSGRKSCLLVPDHVSLSVHL